MARRQGVQASRPAEDAKDVVERFGSTSPRTKSSSYSNVTVCLLLIITAFVALTALGNAGFYFTNPEEPRSIRKPEAVAVHQDVTVHPTEDVEESFGNFLASKDDTLSSQPECRASICDAIPILQEVYGTILHRTLHIGPGTCGVVSRLLKEDDVEIWGIQPFDSRAPIHPLCHNFIQKGIIRVADPLKPLPYRKRSFSLVLVTDTLDHMKGHELNQTLLDLATVSSHSLMLVIGNNVQRRRTDLTRRQKHAKPRSRLWWQRRLAMVGLRENVERSKRFEILQAETSFKTTSNIFHLHATGAQHDVMHELVTKIIFSRLHARNLLGAHHPVQPYSGLCLVQTGYMEEITSYFEVLTMSIASVNT